MVCVSGGRVLLSVAVAVLVTLELGDFVEASPQPGTVDLGHTDPDTGNDLGESATMEALDDDMAAQTSHIDDEVTALGKEFASLEKDNANIRLPDPTIDRVSEEGAVDTNTKAPKRAAKAHITKEEDIAVVHLDKKLNSHASTFAKAKGDIPRAPAPSNDEDADSPPAEHPADTVISGKHGIRTPPQNEESTPVARLRDSSDAEDTTSPDEEAMRLQIEAAEQQKIQEQDANEAAQLTSTEQNAEKQVQQGGSGTVMMMTEAPTSIPDAPAPVRPKQSDKVLAAKSRPMPPVQKFRVLANGLYPMGTDAASKQEANRKEQQDRDLRISRNGGESPRVLPASETKSLPDSSTLLTTDGPVESYSAPTPTKGTGYCRAYEGRRDVAKPKWTTSYCNPDKSNMGETMQNIDGVICACGGTKVSNVAAGPAHPGIQESVYTRAQVTDDRIRSYAYRISSNIDSKSPRPAYGLTWEVRITDEAATVSQNEVNFRQMRSVYLTFNRIVEFMDVTKTGLQHSTVKQQDLETGGLWGGVPCDAGKQSNAKNPGSNCVLQDFFLDRFELSKLNVDKSKLTFRFRSDIQGTAPWCDKTKAECATAPANKPTVTFEATADTDSFSDSKLSVTIENFPYKSSNSSLALGISMFSETVKSDISADDTDARPKPNDGVDCNASPLSHRCPRVDMGENVQLSWAKTVTNPSNGKTFKVVSAQPTRVKSGVTASNGHRLIHKTSFFSFSHEMAPKLLWDPKVDVTPDPLPRDLKSGAHGWAQPMLLTVAIVVCGNLMMQQ